MIQSASDTLEARARVQGPLHPHTLRPDPPVMPPFHHMRPRFLSDSRQTGILLLKMSPSMRHLSPTLSNRSPSLSPSYLSSPSFCLPLPLVLHPLSRSEANNSAGPVLS